MSVPSWLTRILHYYNVPFEVHQHPPVKSASHLAHAEHVSGRWVAKPVFLIAGRQLITVVVPANSRVDLGRVQAVLGKSDLRMATEEEIAVRFKGCAPGALPPLRLRSDQVFLMDRALAHLHDITFAAGTYEDAISMRFRDWYRMVHPGVGHFVLDQGNGQAHQAPTVLIVEDESDTNKLLCQVLERGGYACRAAEDGSHAVSMAREVKPAAILLDIMLPDISGFEVVQRLRQSGPLKPPPVVVVTALDDDSARKRVEDLGADAYLTKPFTADALLKEVQNVMADGRG
jgi:CheY-like chemotaxis protein/prolyl-tRNA editing enzyme YbaK/EbsC (Cys-tRNA(Pro) deacylase)